MKLTSKMAGSGLAGLLLAGTTLLLVVQQQSLNRVRQENRILRQRVDVLTMQAEQLTDEKDRLSHSIALREANAGTPLAEQQFSELLRLRGEVGRLRLQEREIEQSRRGQMQAAQAKLADAQGVYARLKNLPENLVSAADLRQARFKVELLQAQAKGDPAEVSRVRLRQAQEELTRATQLRSQSLISQTEYDEAVRKVELIKAGAEP